MEHWHIKAEFCSGDLSDIMDLVEVFLQGIFKAVSNYTERVTAVLGEQSPPIRIPFVRITYREALSILQVGGQEVNFGQNISK